MAYYTILTCGVEGELLFLGARVYYPEQNERSLLGFFEVWELMVTEGD